MKISRHVVALASGTRALAKRSKLLGVDTLVNLVTAYITSIRGHGHEGLYIGHTGDDSRDGHELTDVMGIELTQSDRFEPRTRHNANIVVTQELFWECVHGVTRDDFLTWGMRDGLVGELMTMTEQDIENVRSVADDITSWHESINDVTNERYVSPSVALDGETKLGVGLVDIVEVNSENLGGFVSNLPKLRDILEFLIVFIVEGADELRQLL